MDRLLGHIDSALSRDLDGNQCEILLNGWLFSREQGFEALYVRLADSSLHRARKVYRPDIARQFPDVTHARMSGFGVKLLLDQVPHSPIVVSFFGSLLDGSVVSTTLTIALSSDNFESVKTHIKNVEFSSELANQVVKDVIERKLGRDSSIAIKPNLHIGLVIPQIQLGGDPLCRIRTKLMIESLLAQQVSVTLIAVRDDNQYIDDIYDTYAGIPIVIAQSSHSLESILDQKKLSFDRLWISGLDNLEAIVSHRQCNFSSYESTKIIFDLDSVIALEDGQANNTDSIDFLEETRESIKELVSQVDIVTYSSDIVRKLAEEIISVIAFPLALGLRLEDCMLSPFSRRSGILSYGSIRSIFSPLGVSFVKTITEIAPALFQLDRSILLEHLGYLGTEARSFADHSNFSQAVKPFNCFAAVGRYRVGLVPDTSGTQAWMRAAVLAACGTVVVCSTFVAQQLGWQNGKELIIADSPDSIAKAAVRLNANEPEWEKIRECAAEKVSTQFSPEIFLGQLRKAFSLNPSGGPVLSSKSSRSSAI